MKEKITEQALLKAAEEVFLEKGFTGAKTMDIAERAGVSHTMLHYYFRTKEQLFAYVAEAKLAVFVDSMRPLFEEGEGCIKERVAKAAGAHFDAVAANPMLPRFLLMEIGNDKVDLLSILKRALGDTIATKGPQLQKEFDEAADRGEIVRVSALNLMLDIASLNYFPFLLLPAAVNMFFGGITHAAFMQQRKQEAIETIVRRLCIDE